MQPALLDLRHEASSRDDQNSRRERAARALSPNLAIRLRRAGVGTARAWMAMRTTYDLARELDGKTHDVQPLVVA